MKFSISQYLNALKYDDRIKPGIIALLIVVTYCEFEEYTDSFENHRVKITPDITQIINSVFHSVKKDNYPLQRKNRIKEKIKKLNL